MPQVEVRQKIVDSLTGSVSYIKRTFKIDENSPENSIEYHKIADLIGLNAFDRLNPHISTKLALIYNWAANATKSNDIDKIYSHIDKCRKASGTMEVGKGLIEGLYRTARFDMQNVSSKDKAKSDAEALNTIEDQFSSDREGAKGLRNQSKSVGNTTSKEGARVDRLTSETYQDFEKNLVKERQEKIRTMGREPVKEEV